MESFSKLNNIKGYTAIVDYNGSAMWTNDSVSASTNTIRSKFRNRQLVRGVPFRYGIEWLLSVWEKYPFSEISSKNFTMPHPFSTHSKAIDKFSEKIEI